MALEPALELPVRGVLGHSFGGKVALELARLRDEPLPSVVVVDAMPGPRPDARGSEATVAVVEMLDAMPRRWPSREAFVAAVETAGHGDVLARWLAMNLEPDADAYRMRLDLDAIAALLSDYFARDLWSVVEAPRSGARIDLVIGGDSDVYDRSDVERARRAAHLHPNVHAHVVAGAGHWVHADVPSALVDIWGRSLTKPPSS